MRAASQAIAFTLGVLLLGACAPSMAAGAGDGQQGPGPGSGAAPMRPGPTAAAPGGAPAPGAPAANPGGPGLFGALGDQLGITAEQKVRIKAVFDAARPEMDRIREDARKPQEEFQAMDPDDPRYEATVARASKAAGAAASAALRQGAATRVAIWKILTPEQQSKMHQIEADFRKRVEEQRSAAPPAPPPSAPRASGP